MERTNDIPSKKALTAVLLVLVASAGWANDAHDAVRFVATFQTTSWVNLTSPAGRCAATAVPLLEAVGAGDTNLLGVVFDKQSHCVGRPDKDGIPFDSGEFTLTSPQGKTVEGRYFGRLVPTFNSKFGPPPSGNWQIKGYVCITKVAGRTVSDCSQPPKNYAPARGMSDLNPENGAPASIFIDQWIRFK